MKFTDRLNIKLHPIFVKYVMRAYRRKIQRVEKEHPELFKPVDPNLVKRHKELWGKTGLPCSDRWLRFHVNLTGIEDYRFCPEDIYFSRIERVLCPTETSGYGIEDKNFLNIILDKKYLPDTIVRYTRGCFSDENYNWISRDSVDEILSQNHGDLVVKPCVASSGGNGVELIKFADGKYVLNGAEFNAAMIERIGGMSYAVQKRIYSDPFSASFNAESANTCRMMTFRRPWDGEVVVLKTMMRLGVTEAVVDNMMKGGLCVNIDSEGSFSQYGYDYNGARHVVHPTSGIKFEGLKHPHYKNMEELVTKIAARIPYHNILSFDVIPDRDEQIKIVEVNASSQGITQLQYDHGGLFGEYSEKVVDWCAENLHLDRFNHIRTFY